MPVSSAPAGPPISVLIFSEGFDEEQQVGFEIGGPAEQNFSGHRSNAQTMLATIVLVMVEMEKLAECYRQLYVAEIVQAAQVAQTGGFR